MSEKNNEVDLLDLLSQDSLEDLNTTVQNIPNKIPLGKSSPSVSFNNPPQTQDNSSIPNLPPSFDTTTNQGSGDLSQDLCNWLFGNDKLPSSPLALFLNNALAKAEYSLFFHMLNSNDRIVHMEKFLNKACTALFDPDSIMMLTPKELENRVVLANTIMNNLLENSRRTIKLAKDNNRMDEAEKIRMMFASIPNSKIQEIIFKLGEEDQNE